MSRTVFDKLSYRFPSPSPTIQLCSVTNGLLRTAMSTIVYDDIENKELIGDRFILQCERFCIDCNWL